MHKFSKLMSNKLKPVLSH